MTRRVEDEKPLRSIKTTQKAKEISVNQIIYGQDNPNFIKAFCTYLSMSCVLLILI